MTKRLPLLLAGLVSIALLNACGGGSSPSANGRNPPPSGNVNGDLTGRVMLGGHRDGWILDLATGSYSRIPGMEQWDDNPDYLGVARVTAFPVAYNGSEIIETVEDCKSVAGQIPNDNCIKIHDQNGTLVKHVNYSGQIVAGAKLSTNNQHVALARQYGDLTSNSYLEIHDRNGNMVSYDVVDDTYASISFDWLPDNRLVYTFKQSIYLTTPLSAEGAAIITFTSNQGEPDEVAVSPDGAQLAFKLITSGNLAAVHGHIWVVNVDGSGLRQLTSVPGDDDPVTSHPAWSPDGQWILAVEGDVNGSGSSNSGFPGILYAIPSDGEKVPLTLDSSTPAQPILSYNAMTRGDSDPELSYKYNSVGNHNWLP